MERTLRGRPVLGWEFCECGGAKAKLNVLSGVESTRGKNKAERGTRLGGNRAFVDKSRSV